MPEERVYFPAGIFPPHLGIDFPTVRDCVSFHCLSGLQILRRRRGLIMRGRTICCTDHSGSLLNWFQFLYSCFFRWMVHVGAGFTPHLVLPTGPVAQTSQTRHSVCSYVKLSRPQNTAVFASPCWANPAAVTSWFSGAIYKGDLDIWCVSTLESVTVIQWLCLVAGEHSKLYVDC